MALAAAGLTVYGQWVPTPKRTLRPIARPGTPRWAPAFISQTTAPGLFGMQVLGVVGITVGLLLGMTLIYAGLAILGVPLIVLPLALLAGAILRYRGDVVAPPGWRYEGMPLNEAVLDLLEDIQGRFDFAHQLIDDVPAGIDWSDLSAHVDALVWECAGNAAKVSALDAEVHELRYAASGTPQEVLARKLRERREEHWSMLVDVQREADSLAREAGNAAAAAQVALARTGSLEALQIVAPSARALVAKGALAEARARLAILTEVWTELDELGQLPT